MDTESKGIFLKDSKGHEKQVNSKTNKARRMPKTRRMKSTKASITKRRKKQKQKQNYTKKSQKS